MRIISSQKLFSNKLDYVPSISEGLAQENLKDKVLIKIDSAYITTVFAFSIPFLRAT